VSRADVHDHTALGDDFVVSCARFRGEFGKIEVLTELVESTLMTLPNDIPAAAQGISAE
jgi:hypothetical protein